MSNTPELLDIVRELSGSAVAAVETLDGSMCGVCEQPLYTNELGYARGHSSDCLIMRAKALVDRIEGKS